MGTSLSLSDWTIETLHDAEAVASLLQAASQLSYVEVEGSGWRGEAHGVPQDYRTMPTCPMAPQVYPYRVSIGHQADGWHVDHDCWPVKGRRKQTMKLIFPVIMTIFAATQALATQLGSWIVSHPLAQEWKSVSGLHPASYLPGYTARGWPGVCAQSRWKSSSSWKSRTRRSSASRMLAWT